MGRFHQPLYKSIKNQVRRIKSRSLNNTSHWLIILSISMGLGNMYALPRILDKIRGYAIIAVESVKHRCRTFTGT